MKIRSVGIRGAGLSGLCVARELLALDPKLRVTLFDTRPRLPHPTRTFCFFHTNRSDSFSVPTVSWPSVVFRGGTFERRIDVSRAPYTMIRGDDFFSGTLQALESQGIECVWGCQTVELGPNAISADGHTRTFDVVIDAAFNPHTADTILWQSFAGVWVTTERGVFDPSAATLMDLGPSTPEAPVSFLYILPTSEHTALLEHTTFSPSSLPREYHLERCLSWLHNQNAGDVQSGASEYGAIPMGLQNKFDTGTWSVGTAAGLVRPATGYAFARTQEHARKVATCILSGDSLPTRPYPLWLTGADTLFLYALRNAPEKGRELMERLLSHTRPDALISFLSGDIRLLTALSVWLSVPKRIMIRSLLRV